MKFGVELVPYLSIDKLVDLAKKVELAGFDHIWVCDHYHNRYVYSVLTQLALVTSKIKLGPGVTNPYVAHPVVAAAAIATLNEISKGRAVLGISAGEPMYLKTIGIQHHKPIIAVSEAVKIIRLLLAGEKVDFSGRVFICRGAKLRFKTASEVPVYIGAQGPQMLELAGKISDGVLINASDIGDLEEAIEHVRTGAQSAGRDLDKIDLVAYMAVSVDEDLKKAKDAVKRIVSFVASSAPPSSLKRHNIPVSDVEKIRRYLEIGDIQRAAAAVTDRMIEAFSLCARPSELPSRIDKLRRIGITQVVIGFPIGPDPLRAIDHVVHSLFKFQG